MAAGAVQPESSKSWNCSLGKSTVFFGAAVLITGIVMCILNNSVFSEAAAYITVIGVSFFVIGILVKCCEGTNDLIETASKGPTVDISGLETLQRPGHPTSPSRDPVPLSISTVDFFASKGIFGLPLELITRIDIWRKFRTWPADRGAFALDLDAGFVLHGPPGTGKSSIAKHMSELLGGTYRNIDGGDLNQPLIGATEAAVSKAFDVPEGEFRVVYMDEITAFLVRRGQKGLGGYQAYQERQVDHFLSKVKGEFSSNPRFLLVGTTNKVHELDEAILREGRLQEFAVDPPEEAARVKIFTETFENLRKKGQLEGEKETWDALAQTLGRFTHKETKPITGATIKTIITGKHATAVLADRKLRVSDFDDFTRQAVRVEEKKGERKGSATSSTTSAASSSSASSSSSFRPAEVAPD